MKNILITGANGFIGRALCKRMLADRYEVRGAVRAKSQMTVLPSRVEGALVGDIGPETDWSEALGGIESICSSCCSVHVMARAVLSVLNSAGRSAGFGRNWLCCMR